MKLVIFDIDGTLTNTVDVDDYCYGEALQEIIKLDISDLDWQTIKEQGTGTDMGMLMAICSAICKGEPRPEEKRLFFYYFKACLTKLSIKEPERFSPVPGGIAFFENIRNNPDYKVAVATGSWEETGLIKLKAAGYDIAGLPYANCNKYSNRKDIIQDAIKQSQFDGSRENIFYIGDGLWDKKATEELGINFIGVDYHEDNILKNDKAKFIIKDFTQPDILYQML
jgi:phosphoglycolate phosphatase-like HAD superfamily hydrolase